MEFSASSTERVVHTPTSTTRSRRSWRYSTSEMSSSSVDRPATRRRAWRSARSCMPTVSSASSGHSSGVGLVGVARRPGVVGLFQRDLGFIEVPAGRLGQLGLEGEVFLRSSYGVQGRWPGLTGRTISVSPPGTRPRGSRAEALASRRRARRPTARSRPPPGPTSPSAGPSAPARPAGERPATLRCIRAGNAGEASPTSRLSARSVTRWVDSATIRSSVVRSWSSVPASAKNTLTSASNSLALPADGSSSQRASSLRPASVMPYTVADACPCYNPPWFSVHRFKTPAATSRCSRCPRTWSPPSRPS